MRRFSRGQMGVLAAMVSTGALLLAMCASAYATEGQLPDLTVSRTGPSSVYASAQFSDKIKVTNKGTAPAAGVVVDYGPALSVASVSKGVTCRPIYKGHSGRGGGYTLVGYACSPALKEALAPTKSIYFELSFKASRVGSIDETFGVEPVPNAGQLNLVSHIFADVIAVTPPPLPAQPTAVSAKRVGDQLQVSWTPGAETAAAITSSTVTLTPVGETSAPPITATLGGPGKSDTVGPVVPLTTYSITVVNTDASGSSPASSPISFTTPPSTQPPSAPTEIRAYWLTGAAELTGVLLVSWHEGSPGDSQIDQYQTTITPGEPEEASAQTKTEPATASNTEFTLMDEMSWTVKVRAHNAAGWGAWSMPIVVPGI
jgi:hypothetical protein